MSLRQNVAPALLDIFLSKKEIQERARRLMVHAGFPDPGPRLSVPGWIALIAYARGPLNVGGHERREVTARAVKAIAFDKPAQEALFTAYRMGGELGAGSMVAKLGEIPAEEKRMRLKIAAAKTARNELTATKKFLAKTIKRTKDQISDLEKRVKYYEREGIYDEIARRTAAAADADHTAPDGGLHTESARAEGERAMAGPA